MKLHFLSILNVLTGISLIFMGHTTHGMHFEPETYACNNLPQRDWIQKFTKTSIPQSDLRLSILDVGCGDGEGTIDLLKNFPNSCITGIDPKSSMIDFAQKTHGHHKNAQWEIASAETLNYNESFDTVVSFSTLQWVQNITKALININRALKKNGYFYALLNAQMNPNPTSFSVLYSQAASKQFEKPQYSELLHKCSQAVHRVLHKYYAKEFTELLKQSGFTPIVCTEQEITYTFENKEQFTNWLLATSPLKTALGKLHESFWQDVVNTYITDTNQNDKTSVVYSHYVLYVIAQK